MSVDCFETKADCPFVSRTSYHLGTNARIGKLWPGASVPLLAASADAFARNVTGPPDGVAQSAARTSEGKHATTANNVTTNTRYMCPPKAVVYPPDKKQR